MSLNGQPQLTLLRLHVLFNILDESSCFDQKIQLPDQIFIVCFPFFNLIIVMIYEHSPVLLKNVFLCSCARYFIYMFQHIYKLVYYLFVQVPSRPKGQGYWLWRVSQEMRSVAPLTTNTCRVKESIQYFYNVYREKTFFLFKFPVFDIWNKTVKF